jgi:RHS repeat-associated protein
VAADYRRGPLGSLDAEPGGRASTPLRLQGQYHDEETGLSYNRFRYFADGLFVSPDPLGVAASLNAFGYAPNTMSWVDPSGLLPNLNAMSQSQLDAHMRQRAQRLHGRMPDESQGRRTTAVGLVEGPNGRRLVYAVSDNRTCAPQRRSASRGGEERVTGDGQHAEQILMNNTPLGPGERLTAVAPSRPACGPERANCAGRMGDAGVRILNP